MKPSPHVEKTLKVELYVHVFIAVVQHVLGFNLLFLSSLCFRDDKGRGKWVSLRHVHQTLHWNDVLLKA